MLLIWQIIIWEESLKDVSQSILLKLSLIYNETADYSVCIKADFKGNNNILRLKCSLFQKG